MGYLIAIALTLLPSAFGGGGSFPTATGPTASPTASPTAFTCIRDSSNCDWNQKGVDIDGENKRDLSGESVAINAAGDIVAIGAPYTNGGFADDAADDMSGDDLDYGQVRIFEWDGSAWSQKGNDIVGESNFDTSGSSVAINAAGDIVAIGAPYSDKDIGHVRIFEWDGSDWSQKGNDIDGEAMDDESGSSVALNAAGDIVAIGAQDNNGASGSDDADDNDYGQVRIFEWDGSDWSQKGSDIDGEAKNDRSGYSVALNAAGDIVAIGAPYNNGASGSDDADDNDYGQVRIFEWDGSDWVQMGNDIDGEAKFDRSAYSVALNAAGDIVASGAPRNNGASGSDDADDNDYGQVRVYELAIVSSIRT